MTALKLGPLHSLQEHCVAAVTGTTRLGRGDSTTPGEPAKAKEPNEKNICLD